MRAEHGSHLRRPLGVVALDGQQQLAVGPSDADHVLPVDGAGSVPVEDEADAADLLLQIVEVAIEAQSSAIEDGDPVSHPLDVGQDVAGEDDGAALLAGQREHGVEQLAAHDGVEVGRRLVEDEDVGLRADRQQEPDRPGLSG